MNCNDDEISVYMFILYKCKIDDSLYFILKVIIYVYKYIFIIMTVITAVIVGMSLGFPPPL